MTGLQCGPSVLDPFGDPETLAEDLVVPSNDMIAVPSADDNSCDVSWASPVPIVAVWPLRARSSPKALDEPWKSSGVCTTGAAVTAWADGARVKTPAKLLATNAPPTRRRLLIAFLPPLSQPSGWVFPTSVPPVGNVRFAAIWRPSCLRRANWVGQPIRTQPRFP